ncbi:MAG: DUF1573 domain-containing protein [Firmicutes bacterium]|nr:DUF1573 domain-containing protein [Bacillota bacterium]
MKQNIILTFIIFTLLLSISTLTFANAPELFIPVTSYDFGRITEGQSVEHVFIIKNTGKAPLEILSVTPDCDCAKVRFSKSTIEAGQQSEIKLVFNSKGYWGGFTKLIIIETNDPVAPVKMIKYQGTVIREN